MFVKVRNFLASSRDRGITCVSSIRPGEKFRDRNALGSWVNKRYLLVAEENGVELFGGKLRPNLELRVLVGGRLRAASDGGDDFAGLDGTGIGMPCVGMPCPAPEGVGRVAFGCPSLCAPVAPRRSDARSPH